MLSHTTTSTQRAHAGVSSSHRPQVTVWSACRHPGSLLGPHAPPTVATAAAAADRCPGQPHGTMHARQPSSADNRRSAAVAVKSASSSSMAPETDSGSMQAAVVQEEEQQRPIQVSVNSSSDSIARAILYCMQRGGAAEVWASSAANHFTAVAALAKAQAQLLEQPLLLEPDSHSHTSTAEPWLERWCHGLSAAATLSAHDQPTKDAQKRRLLKLTLQVAAADELDAALLRPGQLGAVSSNRVKGVPEVLAAMQQRLLGEGGAPRQDGGVCVVEARGEQAVTRAMKAALSLQAAAGQRLALRPVAAKVADVVAEKRGQAGVLADGLLLLWSWE